MSSSWMKILDVLIIKAIKNPKTTGAIIISLVFHIINKEIIKAIKYIPNHKPFAPARKTCEKANHKQGHTQYIYYYYYYSFSLTVLLTPTQVKWQL